MSWPAAMQGRVAAVLRNAPAPCTCVCGRRHEARTWHMRYAACDARHDGRFPCRPTRQRSRAACRICLSRPAETTEFSTIWNLHHERILRTSGRPLRRAAHDRRGHRRRQERLTGRNDQPAGSHRGQGARRLCHHGRSLSRLPHPQPPDRAHQRPPGQPEHRRREGPGRGRRRNPRLGA